MHLAGNLSCAYLSLKQITKDVQEHVIVITETRSPTETEAEQVNMLQYLLVKDGTLRQIQDLFREDATLTTLACVY